MLSRPLDLEFASATDTGLVRSQNEDAVLINPAYRFAVLADGMGGYNAGEVASSMAVHAVAQHLESQLARRSTQRMSWLKRSSQLNQLVTDAVLHANKLVFDASQSAPELSGMGTTLVVAFFLSSTITVGHVGDSRAYRWRGGQLRQLTKDHSLLQEQIDAGVILPEAVRFSEQRNLVTRALGVAPDVDVEVHDWNIEPGDLYLLCSDGLTDMLEEDEIVTLLAHSVMDLDICVQSLIERANDAGGKDNISIILTRVPEPHRGKWFDRLLS